jgi:hypothetical protein
MIQPVNATRLYSAPPAAAPEPPVARSAAGLWGVGMISGPPPGTDYAKQMLPEIPIFEPDTAQVITGSLTELSKLMPDIIR